MTARMRPSPPGHVRQRGAHGLGTLEAGVWEHLQQPRRLADGSVLANIRPGRPGDAIYPLQQPLWVRIISYRITDERLGEKERVYRLVTTLLNPRVAPALELVRLYHERWEVELVFDELKTHQRAQRKVLRSNMVVILLLLLCFLRGRSGLVLLQPPLRLRSAGA